MLKERQVVEISWEKAGTVVTGHLLRIQKVRYADNVGIKYLVKSPEGKLVTFKGASKLDVFLTKADLGKDIEVTFLGNDAKEPKPGMSPAKLFRVAVDEESKPVAADDPDDTGITDDDIPF